MKIKDGTNYNFQYFNTATAGVGLSLTCVSSPYSHDIPIIELMLSFFSSYKETEAHKTKSYFSKVAQDCSERGCV